MDYSLLLAVHNITEEMKTTQRLSLLPPSLLSSSQHAAPSDIVTNTSSSTHEEARTTTSTDSGIAMTTIPNLPTYIQYLRVIEFIRAQQVPSMRASSMLHADSSLSDRVDPTESIETASIRTVKPELSPGPNSDSHRTHETQVMLRTNSKSPIHSNDTSSPFHLANALIGGDVWYHRQNLSRLAMYVVDDFLLSFSVTRETCR